MSHFSRPPQLLKLSHNGRKPNLILCVRHQLGESRQTSEKWSQTYILSISGSLNAVLEQTNSKLLGKTGREPGYFSRLSPASPRSSFKILGFLLIVKHPLELESAVPEDWLDRSWSKQPHSINVLGVIASVTALELRRAGFICCPGIETFRCPHRLRAALGLFLSRHKHDPLYL